ncbi:MAG: HAD family hydrolase [Anaerolineae bacterium]|nr:HAD family hydrolase [Anaerolineae bacterium]
MPFLENSQIEIINPDLPRGRVRSALFDFDGTLSLIREGWQGVMIPMMVEVLQALDTGESEAELTALVTDFVTRLTGKQTVYQMIELAEQVKRRGGAPLDPLAYKWQYLERLWARIEHRVAGLKAGEIAPEDMLVPGSCDILARLKARGVACYLASGTDEVYVKDEAAALGLVPYFDAHIYGARTITRISPRRWSSTASSRRTTSAGRSWSRLATATSRSRTRRRSAGSRWAWRRTRQRAPASMRGSGAGSSRRGRTSSCRTSVRRRACWRTCSTAVGERPGHAQRNPVVAAASPGPSPYSTKATPGTRHPACPSAEAS